MSAVLYPRTDTIQGFTPNHYNAATATIGAVVQTVGTGQHDLTSGGTFTDIADHVYTIVIHTDGSHFQWKKDSGAFSSDVLITGSAQTLSEGVTVTFGHTSGYTVADTFTITVAAGVSLGDNYLENIYVNSAGTGGHLVIYNGTDSTGTKLIDNSSLATGMTTFGWKLSKGIYLALYATAYPDLVVATE